MLEPRAAARACPGAAAWGRAMQGRAMLKWALFFLVVSLIAGALGFTGIAAGAARIAKILFAIFFAIFLLILIFGVLLGQALF